MSESKQLSRQWRLLKNLADSRIGIPLLTLAAEYEVSDRTIHRDLAVLQSVGFPIEEIVGDHGLKRWRMRPFSEQMNFNYTDLISIIMSRRFLEPLAGSPFWEGHQNVLRKVRGALGEHALRYCDKLSQMLQVSGFGSSDYTRRGCLIDRLLQAMEDKRRVLVVYQSIQAAEPVEQELGPQGFIWHNGSLYLIAWSVRREEIRNYKVDRIESVEIGSDLKYAIPDDFNLEDWQRRAFGVFHGGGEDVHTVRIHFARNSARYVQESWWHDSQEFSPQKDGSVHMTLQLSELTAVTKWILSFGRNATVQEPPELVALIREELTGMLAVYEQPWRPETLP
jgi:predicted DNA-binding transcriptional regulator YafY